MDDLENLCRVCVVSGSADERLLINIFETNIHETTIPRFSILESLQTICGLKLSEDDLLPNSICSVCLSRLEEAYKLRELSQTSQEALYDMVFKAEKADIVPEEEENATEYDDEIYEVEYLEEPDAPLMIEAHETEIKIEESEIVEPEQNKLSCCGCQAVFDTEMQLHVHSIRKHRPRSELDLPENKVQCRICYAFFPKEFNDGIHKISEKIVKPMQKCGYCGCNFFTEGGLSRHKLQFHKDEFHKCCMCSFKCHEKDKLLEHAICHRTTSNANVSGKAYQCTICSSLFRTPLERQSHERFPYKMYKKKPETEEEVTVTVIRCCDCPHVFNSMSDLSVHQEQVHLPNRVEHNEKYPVECGGCYRRFKSNSGLNSHLRRASQRKRYACSKCNVTRRTLKELLQHEMGHTGKDAFPCCGCRKRYESKELLEKHSLEEHSSRPKTYYKDEEDITRPFECKICYRKYKSARDLRAHQRFVYYEKIHTCEICGKSFPQQKSLVLHIASHKTEAEFPCPICDKKYKHKAKVRSCVVRHERPRQHKCKICNVIFSRASNLYSHMISHSDERRYKCDICGTTFKRSFHLRKHMYSHTTEMRYGCKYCSTRFSSTAALYKHEVRHTGLLPYECDICNKKLATRQVFIKHYEAHMDESKKVFTCELCPVKYSQSHFLSNHIKYQHRIEPQEKQWNAKFNRKGSKKKGGYRVRGRIYVDSAVQDEEMVILPDEEQQLEYMEDSSD